MMGRTRKNAEHSRQNNVYRCEVIMPTDAEHYVCPVANEAFRKSLVLRKRVQRAYTKRSSAGK